MVGDHIKAFGPDYEHVGWVDAGHLSDFGKIDRIIPHHQVGSFTPDSLPLAYPAFRKKGGNSTVVGAAFHQSGARFYHVPDEPHHAVTQWNASVKHSSFKPTFELSVSSFKPYDADDLPDSDTNGMGEYEIDVKTKPAAPGSIREMANVLKRHFPDHVATATRITGATANTRKATKVYDPKIVRHCTFEDFERYWSEVYTDDYGGSHRPPGPEHGAPLHDLTQIYPDDVYTHPHFYHDSRPATSYDVESTFHIKRTRGKPDAAVTIYRAVPKHVNVINPGDWVTISENYANNHADGRDDFHVISATTRAKHLHTSGDSLSEYGYNGPSAVEHGGYSA
jgi:hypothetical protein